MMFGTLLAPEPTWCRLLDNERLAQDLFDEYREVGREYMQAEGIVMSRFDGKNYHPIEVDAALLEIGMLVEVDPVFRTTGLDGKPVLERRKQRHRGEQEL